MLNYSRFNWRLVTGFDDGIKTYTQVNLQLLPELILARISVLSNLRQTLIRN